MNRQLTRQFVMVPRIFVPVCLSCCFIQQLQVAKHAHSLRQVCKPAIGNTTFQHMPLPLFVRCAAADLVAKQLRIRLVPEMVDLGGETLKVAGEYRLPLKLVLPNGERAQLDVTVSST